MCGTKCPFPELLQYSLAPPFPTDAMLDDSSASLSLRTTLHGVRGRKVGFGPKNVCFHVKNWSLIEAVHSASSSHIILGRIVWMWRLNIKVRVTSKLSNRGAAIFARSPLPPRCNVGRLVGKPFLTNNIAWGEGEGEEGRIWPEERLFPCEKLIDDRGSAFCKLVPHNFGQDCLNVEIKHKSACNFQIIQRMDVKFGMVNVRDLLLVFHPNVAIWGEI